MKLTSESRAAEKVKLTFHNVTGGFSRSILDGVLDALVENLG